MQIRRFTSADLAGVLRLCEAEGWPSLPADPARAARVLTAPGVVTVVAEDAAAIVGFAQLQSDGEIQAHLSLIAVDRARRGEGVGREMIVEALKLAGGLRIDLVTETSQDFYQALPHFRMSGYRLYPTYTGPDREVPGLAWVNGRKVAR